MLGKKKVEVSASRFCRQAIELPYASLFRYPEFTLAISKTTFYRDWPVQGRFRHGVDEASAYGVVHREGGLYADGSAEPLLPVEITFSPNEKEGPLGRGYLNRAGMEKDATYLLQVAISDPDGTIFSGLDTAMSRVVASGYNFLHLRCVRHLDHGWGAKREQADWPKDFEADAAFLKSVDRGEAKIEGLHFEKLSFNNDLTTKAPAWSWAWQELQFDKPGLQDPAVAKWRRDRLRYR